MNPPRVLLADDHALLLEAFAKLLAGQCDVVGQVSDGRALMAAAESLKPDLIVLDISMPQLNGLEAGRQIRQKQPAVKLVFLTMNEDPDLAAEALRLGASGYLLKRCAASELARAIDDVMRGRVYVTPLIAKDMEELLLEVDPGQRSAELTTRQREVLQLLAEGKSMKEVAGVLDLTPRTVAFHKYRIMEQLKITSNAELIQYAVKQHIV